MAWSLRAGTFVQRMQVAPSLGLCYVALLMLFLSLRDQGASWMV